MNKIEAIKELLALLNDDGKHSVNSAPSSSVASAMIGKYAIIRSRNEGINAGVIVDADETGVILKDARRIWHHRPANKSESWYEGVANHGLSDDSSLSGAVITKAIIEDYSVTVCTQVARKSIEGAAAHAQN